MMKKRILTIFSLAFVLSLNLYFRSFPIDFPQLKTQAREIVEKTIQQSAIQDVQKKFPQFYPTAKDEIVRTRVAEYKKYNKKIIRGQARDLYRQLKNRYQDDSGQTYLMELDCWHWGRYVENVLRHGAPGDETIFDKQWDLLMLAPSGKQLLWEQFLYYLSAFSYKFFSIFKVIPLFTFLFFLPLFFSAVFITVLFVFLFRYSGFIGALTSCFFVGLSPMFLQRSCAGWFDTDILNLFFPLLAVFTYILAVEAITRKKKFFWVCFSSFWVGIFSFTWTHWWFIFLIILLYEGFYALYVFFLNIFTKKKEFALVKQHMFSFLTFSFFCLFWILIFSGKEPLGALYNHIKQVFILNKPLGVSIWPNVYSTVGELRSVGFWDIGHHMGGLWLFLLSFLCSVILLLRALFDRTYTDFKRTPVMIFSIWFISMLFATFQGVRFVVFLLIPMGVALGWVVNDIYEYFCRLGKRQVTAVAVMAVIALNSLLAYQCYATAKGIFPLMDDTWYKLLNIIKEKTSQDTIINSWWDFGNWFKVVARRRVIFDGQSQDTPRSYWMAKALLTRDENEAIGILRMLNNGGNKAFEIIDKQLKDPLLSVLLLESVMGLPAENAQAALLKFLPKPVAEEAMKVLYYIPSRADFIVDYSMPAKMVAISYLGDWNFSKIYIAQNFDKAEKDKIIEYLKNLGGNEPAIQQFYQEAFIISTKKLDDWLSRRLQFYSPLANGREKEGIIFFDNGFIYNPKEKSIQSNTGQIPRSLFALVDDNLVENVYPNANSVFSALVYKAEDGMYKCILLDRELGMSMFTRLYFLRGRGLRHFSPFIDSEEGNNYIRVFNIVW